MKMALAKARDAASHYDVPVGCVVVVNGEVLGVGENRREVDCDPTAHAEMIALRDAATRRTGWRMDDATAYVTLEPCVMCAGALLDRIDRLVIGAMDEKAGAVGSRYNVLWTRGCCTKSASPMTCWRKKLVRSCGRSLRLVAHEFGVGVLGFDAQGSLN